MLNLQGTDFYSSTEQKTQIGTMVVNREIIQRVKGLCQIFITYLLYPGGRRSAGVLINKANLETFTFGA